MKKRQKLMAMILAMLALLQITSCSNSWLSANVKSEPIDRLLQEETLAQATELEKKSAIFPTYVSNPELEVEAEPIITDTSATIVSVGDTLCNKPLFNAAYDLETKTYDFSYMFKYIEEYIENATIAIGNCESPMAGPDRGYSGYPCFNAPEHLSIDLAELGIDVMTTANNHCLDKGFNGLSATLDYLDESEIAHVGTSRSEEEQNIILMKSLNGIDTAFLSYTYGTNGISIPNGKEYCVNIIDEALILEQIQQAKTEGADLIVASMHWGNEYQTTESAEQDRLAEFLIANDVQIILGSHPHVLQPMKMVQVETENGEKKEGLVIFSQGNFFSNQRDINTRNTAIFQIDILMSGETGEVNIEDVSYIPLYVNIKQPGAEDRYELLDLNEIIRSYESGEDTWSESMYQLALKESERCADLLEPKTE